MHRLHGVDDLRGHEDILPERARRRGATGRRSARRIRLGVVGTMVLGMVLVLLLASPALAFPDVPTGHPYHAAITDLASRGIINGKADGKFWPDDSVTRQQFAKMIVGTGGYPVSESDICAFTDVQKGGYSDPYFPDNYIAVCAAHKITTGKTATTFDPSGKITRYQAISMVVRAADDLQPGLLTTPPTGWTGNAAWGADSTHGANARRAEYNGLLAGLNLSALSPGAYMSRGEVAQVLHNVLNLLGPSGVWVYVDGSGDYPTIEAAVADIDPGTTIHLGPGVFNLTKMILVDFSFNLAGSGMQGPTSSTVRYAGWVVDVHSVSFSAEDIRFECTATNKAANVMDVGDATVDLLRCYFSGGNTYANQHGTGLYLYGSTEATVTDCVFTENDLDGIQLGDQAYATVTNSMMSDNVQNGVGLFDESSAVVNQSDCTYNGLHGVSANEFSEVTVQNSNCSDNGDGGDYASGIYLEEDTVGTVQNCVCNNNLIDGISTHDNAQLTLANSTCNYNGEDGITFSEKVSGTISNNECSYNSGYDGIDVHDNAYAVVEDNLCVGNNEDGIWFGDDSTGIVRNNECAENHWGLYVDATANPTIGVNNLHDNVIDLFLE